MRERQDRPAAKKFFQAVGLLALALVSVYIIVQCFVIFRQSYKTETAIRYTMAESVRLSGVVAFDSVDVAGSGNLGYLVQDGERVTNGTVVAECYTNDEQGVQRERLDRLARTITLLTKSQNSTGSELSVLTNLDSKRLDKVLQALSGKGKIFCFDREEKGYVAAGASAELAKRCLAVADAFHKKEPLKQGMARGTLLSGGTGREAWSKGIPPKLAFFVVERLLRSGELVSEGDVIRMASHTVSLKSDQAGLRDALLKAHVDGAFTPPNLKDVLEELSVDAKAAAPVLKLLCEDGSLVKVKDGLYFHGPVIQELKARMQAWFGSHDDLDPAGFKELSGGLSRKYVIPLLEYFDRERVTIRVGDKRQFRGRG